MIVPHPDLCDAWAAPLAELRIPVLASTAAALAQWRADADRVDANRMADVILRDPLMTLRVQICMAQALSRRLETPVETVTAGLVHLGIEPFLARFADVPVLEEVLAPHPEALAGALQDVHMAHHAARLAAAIAIERMDEHAELLHQAALLSNFASLLLWVHRPDLMLEMAHRHLVDRSLRSSEIQRTVLGTDLAALEQLLMERWSLPPTLRHLMHGGHAAAAGPQSVALGLRIARHSREGWDNPALPDDFAELGRLLSLTPAAAASLMYRV
jgi:hypothetical protein